MPIISFGSTSYANPTVKTILDELRPGATYTVGQPVSGDTDDVVSISASQFSDMSLDNWNDPNGLAAPTADEMVQQPGKTRLQELNLLIQSHNFFNC